MNLGIVTTFLHLFYLWIYRYFYGKIYKCFPLYLKIAKCIERNVKEKMSKQETVEVTAKLPKPFVDDLLSRKWFNTYYDDLEEFVCDATRRLKEHYMKLRLRRNE